VLVEIAPGGPTATDLVAAARAAGVRVEPLRANRVERSGAADDAIVLYLSRTSAAELAVAAERIALAARELAGEVAGDRAMIGT